jgi:hypothetical protein
MFHHFPDVEDVGAGCLVRSTEFTYSEEENPRDAGQPIFSYLRSVQQTGYRGRHPVYASRSSPPLEFEYTAPEVDDTIRDLDAESLENLPCGLDGGRYRWVDLHGEGLSGILTETDGAWFYKRNTSPIHLVGEQDTERPAARFGAIELVTRNPNASLAGGAQFMDLGGDGDLDVVALDGPAPGFYEHDDRTGWRAFRPFARGSIAARLTPTCGSSISTATVAPTCSSPRTKCSPGTRRSARTASVLRGACPNRETRRGARRSSSPTAPSRSTSPICPATA